MRYTVELIQQELASDNWKLISDTYKNLDEPLVFECPEGHRVYDSWKHIRSKKFCPVCEKNEFKSDSHKVRRKKKDVRRVLALDQSSRKTGYAVYDDDLLVDYGVFESTLDDEVKRIVELKHWFISMVNQLDPDYIGIEGIQYQQQFGVVTFQTLARVQGALMCACVEMDLPYEVCPTNTWRHYCGVKGRSRVDRKRSMQNLVKSWYDVSVSDDEADAVGIGRYVSQCIVPKNDIVEWE